MRRQDVVRELEEIERELDRYEHRMAMTIWGLGLSDRQVQECYIPTTLEVRLRELRLRLDRDELLGADWGAVQ